MSKLWLDIGCGGKGTIHRGWVGVDVLPVPPQPHIPEAEYVRMDFVHDPLPWAACSVDAILASHIIEHIPRADGRVLINRAMGLLKDDACLVITTPDLRKLARAYLDETAGVWTQVSPNGWPRWPGATVADRFNWVMRCLGHEWVYDRDALKVLCREAGWGAVEDLPDDHWALGADRRDHEFGVLVHKTGRREPHIDDQTTHVEWRLARWEESEWQRTSS